jgi:hypothetical protein
MKIIFILLFLLSCATKERDEIKDGMEQYEDQDLETLQKAKK